MGPGKLEVMVSESCKIDCRAEVRFKAKKAEWAEWPWLRTEVLETKLAPELLAPSELRSDRSSSIKRFLPLEHNRKCILRLILCVPISTHCPV